MVVDYLVLVSIQASFPQGSRGKGGGVGGVSQRQRAWSQARHLSRLF